MAFGLPKRIFVFVRRVAWFVATLIMLGLLALFVVFRPDRAIQAGSGLVSQTLCSAAFVSGVDPDEIYRETVRPIGAMSLLDPAIRYEVDSERREVRTAVAGFFRSRSVYRDRFGCALVDRSMPAETGSTFRRRELEIPSVVEPRSVRIRRALDRIFARRDLGTKAVVVMHRGEIIAERYGPGYGPETPLRGWSVAKSITNALIAILVRDGRLNVHDPAPVTAWRSDERRQISIDHLLRMTSGLALHESGSGFDPVSRMLMVETDKAGFAIGAPLEAPPGHQWRYSTGNTVILSRIIRDAVGGRGRDVADFSRRELFERVGMRNTTLELDVTGTPTGSVYASARDWARFGELYRNDGCVAGRRILPIGWVSYSTRPTLDTGYGAGFWLGGSTWRPDWSMPPDAFYASGHLHQKVLIVPSYELVIARFGVTHSADDGFGYLAVEVLRALDEAKD